MTAFDQARHLFQEGLDFVHSGQLNDAARVFRQALSLAPARPSLLFNLAVVLLGLGQQDEAIELLEQAVVQTPDDIDVLERLGVACAESGRLLRSAEILQKATDLEPARVALWTCRGSVLRELGRYETAADCFRRAIDLGADPDLHRFYLASVDAVGAGSRVPAHPPLDYVKGLFDAYSDDFESHLIALGYQAPDILVKEAVALCALPYRRCLDLGCGTGLIGKRIRELESQYASLSADPSRLEGVDVSARMVDLAAQSGVYDQLYQADLLAWLEAAQPAYDAVFAADVFIYVGALEEVFSAVSMLLQAGGLFAFSVEASATDEAGFQLMPSLRYAHSRPYLERLALRNGMDIVQIREGVVRFDQNRPVDGFFVFLRRI